MHTLYLKRGSVLTIHSLPNMNSGFKKNCGFTMLEVIAVLIILGIITAFVVSRSTNIRAELSSETETVKAHLRYAQCMALANDIYSWRITLSSGSPDYYTLSKINKSDGTETNPINLPNEDSPTHTLPTGISITSGSGTVTFDEWGSPGITTLNIILSDGVGNSETITITKNTGFID
jgi:prepilin-type N-terminal cleavage/methylation domain-containing protein